MEGKQYKRGGGGKMIEMWWRWWRENDRNVVAEVEVKTIQTWWWRENDRNVVAVVEGK